jgi:hypothetical protein
MMTDFRTEIDSPICSLEGKGGKLFVGEKVEGAATERMGEAVPAGAEPGGGARAVVATELVKQEEQSMEPKV